MISQILGIGIGLVGTAILARILLPEDFGIVGMASAVVGFATLFSDSGLTNATIQREDITPQQVSNLFWISILIGIVLSVITAVILAPLAVWMYDEPKVAMVAYIAAVGLLVSAIQIQPLAQLKRSFRFGAISVIAIVTQVVTLLTTISIAYITKSYLALAIGPIVGNFSRSLLAIYFARWKPLRYKKRAGTRSLVVFGANVTGFSALNYFSRNADNMLIGAYLGAASLGFYTKAYGLMMLPIRQINNPFTAVALPMLSRLQDQPERYLQGYSKAIKRLLLLTTPIGIVGIFCGHTVIELFLGQNWDEAKPIFAVLSVNCILQPLFNSTGWLFQSQNRTKDLLKWGLFSGPYFVLSFAIGIPFGSLGVAVSYTIAMILITPFLFFAVGKSGPVDAGFFFAASKNVLIHAIVCSACVGLLNVIPIEVSPSLMLFLSCLSVGFGTFVYLLIVNELGPVIDDLRYLNSKLGIGKN